MNNTDTKTYVTTITLHKMYKITKHYLRCHRRGVIEELDVRFLRRKRKVGLANKESDKLLSSLMKES